jgi:membrane protease YdiL (CAAX protease family)
MAADEISLPPPQPPARATAVAPAWHTIVFVIVLIGFSSLQSLPRFAAMAATEPSRIPTYLLTVAFELLMLGYIWLGLRRYKVPMRELIGGKWNRFSDFLLDVGVALIFWIAVVAMLAGLSFALHFKGEEAAKFLLPQTWTEVAVWIPVAVTAGFCEEFIFRGYLQRQCLALTGNVVAAIALQAIVFGIGHLYQGVKGVVVISIYGAMFGILAVMRKSLRPGMIQHAGQDTISGIAGFLLMKYKIPF